VVEEGRMNEILLVEGTDFNGDYAFGALACSRAGSRISVNGFSPK
jgi:hypothetical protein